MMRALAKQVPVVTDEHFLGETSERAGRTLFTKNASMVACRFLSVTVLSSWPFRFVILLRIAKFSVHS